MSIYIVFLAALLVAAYGYKYIDPDPGPGSDRFINDNPVVYTWENQL